MHPAVEAVHARLDPEADLLRLRALLAPTGVEVDRLLDRQAPITVHFHPDQPLPGGRRLVDGLLTDGDYHNQFTSGISGGALAHADRFGWEDALFADAYAQQPACERPRYGGWNVLGAANGACPRYGITHLRVPLHAVARRTTLSFGDSAFSPTHVGSPHDRAGILCGVFEHASTHGHALGHTGGLEEILAWMLDGGAPGRCLGGPFDYVEAHVHGGLQISAAEAIVVDDAYADTVVGAQLQRLADEHALSLEWVSGPRLRPEALPARFPGVEPVVRRWQVAAVDGSTAHLTGWLAARMHATWIDAAMVGQLRRLVEEQHPDVRWLGGRMQARDAVKDLMTALVVLSD